MSWLDHANCKGLTHLFYPDLGRGQNLDPQLVEARALCASCPVKAECLADALANEPRPRDGFRAGLRHDERAVLAGEKTASCVLCGASTPGPRSRYCSRECKAAARNERLAS